MFEHSLNPTRKLGRCGSWVCGRARPGCARYPPSERRPAQLSKKKKWHNDHRTSSSAMRPKSCGFSKRTRDPCGMLGKYSKLSWNQYSASRIEPPTRQLSPSAEPNSVDSHEDDMIHTQDHREIVRAPAHTTIVANKNTRRDYKFASTQLGCCFSRMPRKSRSASQASIFRALGVCETL
jgi:hypothetical protein